MQDAVAYHLNRGERDGFDTRKHLRNAYDQAVERGLDKELVIDFDAHHYETDCWSDIVQYIEDPVLRHTAILGTQDSSGGQGDVLTYSSPRQQNLAGRIRRQQLRKSEVAGDSSVPREAALALRAMDMMAVDYQVVFPTPMLELGMHPDPNVERHLSWAYTRWMIEEILPTTPRIRTMAYLPFNDPEASLRVVQELGDKPGVVGFMVTATRFRAVHDNQYMPLYGAIEETGKPLGFHASIYQQDRWFEGMNKFLSAHALGFVFPNMVHLTNMVMNGIPERFPNLKVVWIESGLAWVPFLMQRLDNEYLMRSSEAPLLRRLPSEYMSSNFYYTTQPMETQHVDALELTLKMINAETQLLYSSDYPHWDFNLPSTVWDLPFLNETTKRRILGLNAQELFQIEPEVSGPSGARSS